MSSLSQRLHLGVQQKQILTPGLVQMVTILQQTNLELKDMILNEIAENIVLEEASSVGDELTPEEVQAMLERERQTEAPGENTTLEKVGTAESLAGFDTSSEGDTVAPLSADEAPKPETDPFDEIDYGSFFDEYLDPGFKSPASETIEKPSFETFLSQPVTLPDHLRS